MTTFDCELLVRDYADWIRGGVKVESVGESCVLTSPFLDRHRDYLQVYVEKGERGFVLSDDGYVLRDLRISGLEINTDLRREALGQILRSYGIVHHGDELRVEATEQDLPQRKHDLIQAMLAVGALIHIAQPTVASLFKEDVERFLQDRGVATVPDVRFTGASGLTHSFDFAIPRTEANPERYVSAIGTPNRESVVSLMFSWEDVKIQRPSGARVYAILNDGNGRRISPDHVSALEKYEIGVMPWSEREDSVSALRG